MIELYDHIIWDLWSIEWNKYNYAWYWDIPDMKVYGIPDPTGGVIIIWNSPLR